MAEGAARAEPIAVAAWEADRLVGLLVLAARRRFGARVAGIWGAARPGYQGALVDEARPEAVDVLAQACHDHHFFDLILFENVSSLDPDTRRFIDRLGELGWRTARARRAICRRIRLGSSFESYMRHAHSKKARYNLRRLERIARRDHDIEIQRFDGPEVNEAVMQRVADLQLRSWLARRGAADFAHARRRTLLKNIARASLASVHILRLDRRDAAFVIATFDETCVYYEWTAFDLVFRDLSVGQLLTRHVIRQACDEGYASLDFGQGDAAYKRFWSNDSHSVDRMAAARGPAGNVLLRVYRWFWTRPSDGRLRRVCRALRGLRRRRAQGRADIGAPTCASTRSPHRCFETRMAPSMTATPTVSALPPDRVARLAPDPVGAPTIIVAQTAGELGAIEEAWSALLGRSGSTIPNPEPDFLRLSCEAAPGGATPYVALFNERNHPSGLLVGRTVERRVNARAGYLHLPTPRLRVLEILYGGALHGDNTTIIARQAQHLTDLLDRRVVDHIMFNELPVDDPLADALDGARIIRPPASRHWITSLEGGSYDAVMQRHKGAHRRNFRRYDRRLCEHCGGALRLEVVTAAPAVTGYLARAATFAAQTYQAGLGAGLRDDASRRRLLRGLAERGWLRCYLLVAGDEPIAFHSGLCYRNRWTAWGTGYRPDFRAFRPGTILITRIFRDLCEHGVEAVDWSFGDAQYKRVFGTDSREERTIHLYSRGIRAGCAFGIDAAATWSKRALERLDRSGSFAERIKRHWRRRLERGR